MPAFVRWVFGLAIAAFVIGVPAVYHRWVYTHGKRLREVTPGVLYRSGQLTADGFADAVERFGLRTIINLQDDYIDPDVATAYFTTETIKESELCRRLGVRYVQISPDVLHPRRIPQERPTAIDQFLAVMDDPTAYPVLIHCRAGLHRTGVIAAVYRMEYQGWSHRAALDELRALGFGEYQSTSANDYIQQYVLTFKPGVRGQRSAVRSQRSEVRDQESRISLGRLNDR